MAGKQIQGESIRTLHEENSYNEVAETPSKKYMGFLKYRISWKDSLPCKNVTKN